MIDHNHLLLSNRNSGKAAEAYELLNSLNTQSIFHVPIGPHTDLRATIRQSLLRGCDTVIAAGGDGTVNAVVNAIMRIEPEQRPSLAILPLGTANDFAGTLYIPDDILLAIELLNTSSYVPIDVVKIQAAGFAHYFANVAAGGNSVRVSEEMTEEMKRTWGAFCYLRGAFEVLADLKTFRIDATCDQEKIEGIRTWAVLVANGKTNAGRIVVAPDASPIDGLMDVIIIRDGTLLDIMEIVSNGMLGNYLECEQVLHRQVKQFVLHSEPAMRFTLDGEVIDHEPVQFNIIPAAIRTWVGQDFFSAYPLMPTTRPEPHVGPLQDGPP
jgi:diacylglycerol kinase (ATP)